MAWLAVEGNGDEWICSHMPERSEDVKMWNEPQGFNFAPIGAMIYLPKGSIKKLIGKDLTWNDEPVEI